MTVTFCEHATCRGSSHGRVADDAPDHSSKSNSDDDGDVEFSNADDSSEYPSFSASFSSSSSSNAAIVIEDPGTSSLSASETCGSLPFLQAPVLGPQEFFLLSLILSLRYLRLILSLRHLRLILNLRYLRTIISFML
jgi:hypothetical protein